MKSTSVWDPNIPKTELLVAHYMPLLSMKNTPYCLTENRISRLLLHSLLPQSFSKAYKSYFHQNSWWPASEWTFPSYYFMLMLLSSHANQQENIVPVLEHVNVQVVLIF